MTEYIVAGLFFIFSVLIAAHSFWFAEEIALSADLSAEGESVAVRRRYNPATMVPFIRKLKISRWLQILVLSSAAVSAVFIQMHRGDMWVDVLKTAMLASTLLAVSVVDWHTKKIPNYFIVALIVIRLPLLVLEFLFRREQFKSVLISSLIGLLLGLLILLFFSIITKGGFGMGDVKIVAASGFFVGLLPAICSLLYGMVICMMASLVLIIMKKKTMKDVMPFGPFFFFGYIVLAIFGTFQ
ncbi:MAG: A24 family peptidase [Oscillospiraceae bacterium]|nr:A24 family peptidase [Oscillospiraceae bacterium]